MTKGERGSNELNSFHKKSLKTSRHVVDSKKNRLREKSQKFITHNTFKNRLKGKDHSRNKRIKANHSMTKGKRNDISMEHSRGKKFRKVSKNKNSMVLKNYDDLNKNLNGDVKVIYKGEAQNAKKKGKGLYTKKKYVFADLKEGVEREKFMGNQGPSKMEMIYKQEAKIKGENNLIKKKGEIHFLREIHHIDATTHLTDETPNIYSNQKKIKNLQKLENSRSSTKEKNKIGKFINVNEKKIRVSGFRKEKSKTKKRKLESKRKLSTISKTLKSRNSREKDYSRGYKSSLKNRLGWMQEKRENSRLKKRDSAGKKTERRNQKSGSQTKIYSKKNNSQKTNIYQKTGPEFKFPKSEIEFEGKNVQNSIYLQPEETKLDEGTTISEKTENSLACKENIEKTLEISQSPEPHSGNLIRNSTKNPKKNEENTYFEMESGLMEYAKSEDFEGERRVNGEKIGGHSSGDIMGKKTNLEEVTSLEEKEKKDESKRKMKFSQSEAGTWQKMIKTNFKGAKSGDLGFIKCVFISFLY